jgi:7-cyano-7-deazaguanine synthase
MPKNIILLSGGLDSTVNFKYAHDSDAIVAALTFDYGQRAARREMSAAAGICRRFKVKHARINIRWLGKVQATALTAKNIKLPKPKVETLDDPRGQKDSDAVWIPNRNGVFINIAAAYAEAWGADTVVTGFNAEEALHFPDNSAEFIAATNGALQFSTRGQVRVISHTIAMDKAEIMRLGRELGAPLDLCWYCYDDGGATGKPCGRCESCLRFRRAERAK